MESTHTNDASLVDHPGNAGCQKGAMKAPLLIRGAAVVDPIILIAAVGAMIAINREWLFSWKNWIDTWMYVGYFLHYDLPGFLDGNKKIARLPWILLGFFFYKSTSPIIASYILHAGLFIAGALAFYHLAAKFFGRQAGILATLTYLTSQTMHGAGGWDYHNTLVPLLYFLSFWSLDSALLQPRRLFVKFLTCGALFALTIHTSLLVLLAAPAVIIHLIFRISTAEPEMRRPGQLLCGGAGLIVGAAVVTVCLGLINLTFGRQFLFFMPLLTRSAALLASPSLESAWWRPWSDPWWAGDGDNLQTAMTEAVLFLVLVFSFLDAACRLAGKQKMKPVLIAINFEYVASIAFAAVFQSLGHPILQPNYMAFPLYLPMFLSLAGLISYAIQVGSRRPTWMEARPLLFTAVAIFAAIVFVAQVSGRWIFDYDLFEWMPAEWYNGIPLTLTVLALIGGAVLSRLPLPGRLGSIVAGVLCFTWIALMLGQANANWPANPNRWKAYEIGNTCSERRSIFSAVIASERLLFALEHSGRHAVIWYQGEEEVGPSQSCMLTTSQIGIPLLTMGYTPELRYWEIDKATGMPATVVAQLVPSKDVLVVISSSSDYVSNLINRLQQRDTRWHEADIKRVGEFAIKFDLHLIAAAPFNPPGS
jgi:hypothetical protein